MGRKKKYANAAEKQRAWRLRHGQPRKVPLEIRRGERTGASETELRERKEGESWEEYHSYLSKSVSTARRRQEIVGGAVSEINDEEGSLGAKRSMGGYKEPEFPEEYYEIRRKYESDLVALIKKQRGEK